MGLLFSESVRTFITYGLILSSSLVILTEIKFKVPQSRNMHDVQLSNFKGALLGLARNHCLLEGCSQS